MNIELKILDFIRNDLSGPIMDEIMKFITFFGDKGWFWIVLGIALLWFPKTRKMGLTVCIALIFSLILCNLTLKPIIARIRPYDVQKGIQLIISAPHDYSFPSGHTSASFASAFAVLFNNKKWGSLALAFASLIAFSRLYLYVHFPTDVLGGLVLGCVCAVLAYYTVKFLEKKYE